MIPTQINMDGMTLLSAICWVNQVTFPDNLQKDLIELGASKEIAFDILFAFKGQKRNVMGFYQEYCNPGHDPEDPFKKYMALYITKMINEYQLRISKAKEIE